MSVSGFVQPKRGYLANLLSIPPLIYPFQYNPTQIVDAKQVKWENRPSRVVNARGIEGLMTGLTPVAKGGVADGFLSTAKTVPELVGRTFSAAGLKEFKEEGDRTVSFKFEIDGREKRPGEPDRRRNDAGHILGDLAILRSFVYPRQADLLDIIAAIKTAASKDKDPAATTFANLWFNQPPTAVLVLGSMSMEGYVTDLRITETLFNDSLDPTRAEVEMTMIEKIDSISFIIDSIKRMSLTYYDTAYEDIGDVIV